MTEKTSDYPDERIINELLNDSLWLSVILEIKKKVDVDKKEPLATFLDFYSSIFTAEIMEAGMATLSDSKTASIASIKEYRVYNLKSSPKQSSDSTRTVIKEMGVDFNNYIFDLVLLLDGNELLDINFRNWSVSNKSKFALIDGIVASATRYFGNTLPNESDLLKDKFSKATARLAGTINSKTISRKSYASSKLFKESSLSDDSKLFILKRYGLVKNVLFVDELFQGDYHITLGSFTFELQDYIIKAKAIVIEVFGSERGSPSLSEIFIAIEAVNKDIPPSFYAINRKVRNNLHYGEYHDISKSEKALLLKYQDVYLCNILRLFSDNISYDFGAKYKIANSIARLTYTPPEIETQ